MSLILIAISAFMVSCYLAPCIALTHSLVEIRMRAMASAILFLVLNIVGLGCGPLFTGMVSDFLLPTLGTESLRWAMGTITIANVLGAVFFVMAAKTIREELNNDLSRKYR
jgi:hypothetical protein